MENRRLALKYCTVESDGWRTVVTFPDGSTCDAVPHDTHHYHIIAHRCGYGDDIAAYCFEHEVAHALIAEWFWDGPSPVLQGVASGRMLSGKEAASEELLAQTLQRFCRAGEQPIIGGVNWGGMKREALGLLDGTRAGA